MIRHLLLFAVLLPGLSGSSAPVPDSPHVVFMIGEDEYHTWETLPEFAKTDLEPRGYRSTVVHADTADKNSFPGLVEALRTADLLVVSVRRRTPPADQLAAIRAHLDAGKPLVGIRTACHAFALRPADPPAAPGHVAWQDFDPEVLGGHYTNHHPAGAHTTVTVTPGAASHPILKGISIRALTGAGTLYKVSPLKQDAAPLLIGAIPDQPQEPVAWTRLYGPRRARVFFTSFGHPDDFKNAEFRRLLLNSVSWSLGK